MSIAEITSIISAATALIAVLAGPLITLRVAKLQLQGSTTSRYRHEWLDKLRSELADAATHLYFVASSTEDIEPHAKYIRSVQYIGLLLNSNEDEHKQLMDLMLKAIKEVLKTQDSDAEPHGSDAEPHDPMSVCGYYQGRIQVVARSILKKEWDRVKTWK